MQEDAEVEIALVTALSDQELEDAASVAIRAYNEASSPGISLLTGGKLEHLPDLFRAMTLCCLLDGECYVVTDATTSTGATTHKKIVGIALWFPPGSQLWATDEARRASGFNTFFAKLDQPTKDWWVNEYQAQVTVFLKEHYGQTQRDSWWLSNIAVLPEYQRRGIATSLLHTVLKKATTDQVVGFCTDTEKNAKFYRSLDFTQIGILHMRHPGDGSGVKVWGFKQYGLGASV